MVRLDNQKAIRGARGLAFCYLCGLPFLDQADRSRDHVPPAALFAPEDHDYPLILDAHRVCNVGRNHDDELISQLVQLLWREVEQKPPRLDLRRIEYPDGTILPGLRGAALDSMVFRWIRAAHAALYGEYLDAATPIQLCLPLQEARIDPDSGQLVDVGDPTFAQHAVAALKKNRACANTDRIACNNGNFLYECVWGQDGNRRWVCAFGIDVYGWARLGDTAKYKKRGCCGFYVRSHNLPPIAASSETTLSVRFQNTDTLDPFGA